jgi:hypothetical protein
MVAASQFFLRQTTGALASATAAPTLSARSCAARRTPRRSDQMGNKGAFITFESDMVPHFTSFDAVPHPTVRPMRFANPMLQYM